MYSIDDPTIDRLANEPWYVSSRASQQDRFQQCLRLITTHAPQPGLVYDVGCANGQFSARLANFAAKVIGLDTNQARISQNVKTYQHIPNLDFCCGNFLEMDVPEQKADVITALEILYYFSLEEQHRFLQEARDLLLPGGYLLLSVNIFFTSHFSEESLTELVSQYFKIVDTHIIYRNMYYRFELPLIRWLDEIKYLTKLRIFTPNILYVNRNFFPGLWNWLLLRPSWFLDKIGIPLTQGLLLKLLESKTIYRSITGLSKTFFPDKSRSQMIILAQKIS